MNKKLNKLFNVLFVLFVMLVLNSYSSNAPTGNTGAPGESKCSNCHGGNNPQGLDGEVRIQGIPATISASTTYPLTVTVTNPNGLSLRTGFQIVALDADNNNAGSLSNPSANGRIQTSFNNRQYFGHAPSQAFDPVDKSVDWTVDWTSPPANGMNQNISFYGVGNITDTNPWSDTGNDFVVFTDTSTTISGSSVSLRSDLTSSNITNLPASAQQGDVVNFNFDLNNIGDTLAAGTYTIGFYLSTDTNFSMDDTQVGVVPTGNTPIGTIPTIPAAIGIPGGQVPTTYYLIIVTDVDSEIDEKDESNNIFVSSSTINIGATASLSVSISSTHVNCAGENNGEAVANASGGLMPYQYSWSNGDTTSTINNLAPATYQVTVTDANGSTVDASTTIRQPDPLFVQLTKQLDIGCGNDTVSISSNVGGGTAPYTYLWSNGSTDSTLENVIEGTYRLTVTDQNNCSMEDIGIFPDTDPLIANISNLVNVACPGDQTGTAEIMPSGGTGPYTVTWPNGSQGNNLAAGNYMVTIIDNNQCQEMVSVTILQKDTISPIARVKNIQLALDGNGTGSISAADINDGSSDNCNAPVFSIDQTDFDCSHLGNNNIITFTATDQGNNQQTATAIITVVDDIHPLIDCPDSITSQNCASPITYPLPNATDNCNTPNVRLLSGLASGSVFPIGESIVVFEASDATGNTTTCSMTVSVSDTTPPLINCPDSITSQNCATPITYPLPNATDNCDTPSVRLLSGLASGSVFPIGESIVVFEASDATGNTTTCSMTVTVSDTTPPLINCPDSITSQNCATPITYTLPYPTQPTIAIRPAFDCSADWLLVLFSRLENPSSFLRPSMQQAI